MVATLVGVVTAAAFLLLARWNRGLRNREAGESAGAAARPSSLDDYRQGVPFIARRGKELYAIREVPGEGWEYIALVPRVPGLPKFIDGETGLRRADMEKLIADRELQFLPRVSAQRLWDKHFFTS